MSCVRKIRGISNSHCRHYREFLGGEWVVLVKANEEMKGPGYAN
jgi:hypothetical protein